MNRILYMLILIANGVSVFAQTDREHEAIKSLCGCFEIDFKYAETFASDSNYTKHPPYTASALEWVFPEESTDKKYVMQHLLIISDEVTIKHWREDWEYEKSNWWDFKGKGNWQHNAQSKPNVTGQWTQTVWEVDDAPRYQGSSSWLSNDNKYYWENTVDAPLPRREYTKRNDYDILRRTNRLVVDNGGWVHEQDNKKLTRGKDMRDKVLVEEKGYNIYTKVPDSKCAKAAIWWNEHREFWAATRQAWNEVLNSKKTFTLRQKVDDKTISDHFTAIEKQKVPANELKGKLVAVLEKFVQ